MKRLVFSDNASVIEWQVKDYLKEGWDLDGSPFVMAGNFCQWMVQSPAINEYKLVSAFIPSEFESSVLNMESRGWRLFGDAPVDWCGLYCQWMSRRVESPLMVEDRRVTVAMPAMNLVERVQRVGVLSFLDFSFGVTQ